MTTASSTSTPAQSGNCSEILITHTDTEGTVLIGTQEAMISIGCCAAMVGSTGAAVAGD